MEAKTSSACSRSQDACTRMYPKAVHQKLMPNDGVRVRRVSDSRTIPLREHWGKGIRMFIHFNIVNIGAMLKMGG